MRANNVIVILFTCLLTIHNSVMGVQYQWSGSVDTSWDNPGNWDLNVVPGADDTALFNTSSVNCALISDITIKSILFTPGYTGQFTMGNKRVTVSGDIDFSSGGVFFITTFDTLVFNSSSLQKITGKPGTYLPFIIKDGTGTLEVHTVGFKTMGLSLNNGILSNFSTLSDTVNGDLKCTGGQIRLNNGSIVIVGNADFSGLQNFNDTTGTIYFNGVVSQYIKSNSSVRFPAIEKSSSYDLVIGHDHFCARSVKIMYGQTKMDTTFNIDSLSLFPGSVMMLDTTSNGHDTIMYLNGNGNLNVGNGELCFSGTVLDLSSASLSFTGLNSALAFIGSNQTFIPSTYFMYNKIRRKGTGVTTITNNGLRVDTLELISGEFNLGNGLSDSIHGAIRMLGGTLNFSSSTVRTGTALLNLNGTGTIIPSSGVIEFISMGTQHFVPPATTMAPIIQSSGDQLHIKENRLRTSKLQINSGIVILDTTITIDTINVNSGATLMFDTIGNQKDTIGNINGNGMLMFGKTIIHVNGDANFGNLNSLSGNAELEFGATENRSFVPNSNFIFNKIKKIGNNILTIDAHGLRANTLAVLEGTLSWGSTYNDTIYDTIHIWNATLNLGNSPVAFRSLVDSNGVINFNYGSLARFGGDGVIDLAASSSLSWNYGGINFEGNSGATVTLFPSPTFHLPPIHVNGNDTIKVDGNFQGSTIFQNSGGWDWGNNYTHTVHTVSVYGGMVAFGNTTVAIDSGSLMLESATDVRSGNATILFNAASGIQSLTPPSSSSIVLPQIIKSDTSTLQMVSHEVRCRGFRQNAGKIRFSGFGIIADSSIIFENVDSLQGLDGITLQAGQSMRLSGASDKMIHCNSASQWYINVPGDLIAKNAIIGNCIVSGTSGIAYPPYIDAGGNSNWIFWVDTFPPDNDLVLNLQSLDTGRVRIWWNPVAIDSSDAEFVGIRYSSSKIPDSVNDPATILLGTYSLSDSVDTIINLNAHTTYNFAAAVSDLSGNWSEFTSESKKTIRTRAIAPYSVTAADTVRKQSFTVSWVNPPGLSGTDSIFIHTALAGNSSWDLSLKLPSVQTEATIALPAVEGLYRYMISTSHDSAGAYYATDAFIDTVTFSISSPMITIPKDTFYNYFPSITWQAPEGFGISDSFYVFSDTITGKSNWVLKGRYPSNVLSHSFSFTNYGLYKVMVSTNWDKYGTIDYRNIAVDTLLIIPSSKVFTWDISSDSGYQTSNGIWGSDRFWSNEGRSLTGWPGAGNTACFSARTTNSVIEINGTQYTDSIIFNASGYKLSGGTLVLSKGIIRGVAVDTINSTLSSNAISTTGLGEIVLTGKTLCDSLNVFGGLLTIHRSDSDTVIVPNVLSVYTRVNGYRKIAKKVVTYNNSSFTPVIGSAGKISLDEIAMSANCTLNIDIGSLYDTISVQNNAIVNGYMNISPLNGFGKGTYPVIICSGTLVDSGIKIAKTPSASYTYQLSKEANAIVLRIDTLLVDTIKPEIKINLISGSFFQRMPSVISGNASDSLSGLLSLSLLINRYEDSTYWNGTGWQKGIFWLQMLPEHQWSYSCANINSREGRYVVKTGATDSAGNMAYDTTALIVDTTAPVITRMLDNIDSIGSWNGLLSGEAIDSLTMIRRITVSVKNDSGMYYDGMNWIPSEIYLVCDGTSKWSLQIDRNSLREGVYTVSAITSDTIGNISPTPYTKVYSYFLRKDTVLQPPTEYFANLRSVAVNCTTINYFWNPRIPEVVDSIQLVVSLSGNPMSVNQGEYHFLRSRDDSSLTISNIPGSGVTVYSKLFMKDAMGGYTVVPDSAATIARLVDCVTPVNLVQTKVINLGDSLTTINLKAGNTDSVQIVLGFGVSKELAEQNVKIFQNRDTTWTSRAEIPGEFYWAYAVRDAAGNRSLFKYDSIQIKNTPPRLQMITDTIVFERSTLIRTISAYDINKDSLLFSLSVSRSGMSIIGPLFKWTPGEADIGSHSVVIECNDGRGAVSFDTFNIIVKDIPEAPEISYIGNFEIFEDSSYEGIVNVTDPDNADTQKVSIVKLPPWVKLSENKLTGIPKNEDVGIHPVELIYTDKSSLSDTLAFKISVINTNDKPVIIASSISDTISEKQKHTFDIIISDVDQNDSLTIKSINTKSWLKINSITKMANGKDWAAQISCSPVQADTGLHNLQFEIADKALATVYLNKKIRVLDSDDPPSKPVIAKRIVHGAVQLNVSAVDDRDVQLIYSVKVRSLQSDSIVFKDSSVRVANLVYPLYDGKYELKAIAVDAGGLKSIETIDTFLVAGASENVFKDTGWSMVSIPSRMYPVANLKGTKYLLNWDESGVEKQVYSYYRKKEEITDIEGAKAYWRKGITNDTVRLECNSFVKEPVTRKLNTAGTGWNQISSPYPYTVAWPRKSDVLWRWNSKINDYEEVQNVLEPWKGYWVRVDTTVMVTLSPVPVFSTGTLAKLRKSYFQNKDNWTMQVSIRTDGGCDVDNKFGFNQNAMDRVDEQDRPEPPSFEGRPVLYFNRDEWKTSCKEFASDIRKNWKSVNIFEFALMGSKENENGILSFDGLVGAANLYVFTKINDSLVQVEDNASYSVPLSTSKSYQTVFVTDNAKFLLTFPLHFKMGNPYPNPFCPSTRINYTLPYKWSKDGKINLDPYTVTIDIYDILGRKLRCLVYRKMTPGNYSLVWNGKSESGRVVASGKYYCVLKADELKQVRNLTLIK